MSRIADWWRHLTGREPTPPAPPASPTKPRKPSAPGELELADEAGPKKPSRTAEAGFDPYSSDGGFAKPHSWERIDHD